MTLFDPFHRYQAGGSYPFSLTDVFALMNLNIQSNPYIDDRELPGVNGPGVPLPGPFWYRVSVCAKTINIVPNATFLLSDWLATGFWHVYFGFGVPHSKRPKPHIHLINLSIDILEHSKRGNSSIGSILKTPPTAVPVSLSRFSDGKQYARVA